MRVSRACLSGGVGVKFVQREIPFVRELKLSLAYKGQPLNTKYSPDFICYGSVVVELKALNRVGGIEEAQVINYLRQRAMTLAYWLTLGKRVWTTGVLFLLNLRNL